MLASLTLAVSFSALTGWQPTYFRWNPGELPIPYCLVGNASRTNLSSTQQANEVVRMINAWRSSGVGGGLTCSIYDAIRQNTTCATSVNLNDGQNAIFWEQSWSQGSLVLGVTHYTGFGNCGSIGGQRVNCTSEGDIEFNDASTNWNTTGSGGTDIASIALHEYGHFIGLGHCNDNGTCQEGTAVMYASYPGGRTQVPLQDDVTGACALYPGTAGGVGFGCQNNSTCTSNICLSSGGGSYCTATCASSQNCPQGFSCEPNPQNTAQNVCIRDDGLNQGLCEVCQGGVANACANSGECVGGLSPNQNEGRCVTPCGAGGACPATYTCATFQGGETFCIPESQDCTDLGSFDQPLCGICDGPTDCANSGVCAGGLSPNQNEGRCVTPCPSPGSGNGGCPNLYTCVGFQSGGNYCIPSSEDCTDLNVPVKSHCDICSSSTQCGGGTCASGVSPTANEGRCLMPCPSPSSPNGGCPNDYACIDAFGSGDLACVPKSSDCTALSNYTDVTEGQACTGNAYCSVGVCLNDGMSTLCYRDCEGQPGVCNNAQTCTTYQLQSGGSVSVCEPPGAMPRPDAGVPDSGTTDSGTQPDGSVDGGVGPRPDAGTDGGVGPTPDGGVDPQRDGGVGPTPDGGVGPTPDGGVVNDDAGAPAADAGVGPNDDAGTGPVPDAGNNNNTCACDQDFCCTENCDCDQECQCACDQFVGCEEGCSCDPDCEPGCPGSTTPPGTSDCKCTATTATDGSLPLGLGLLAGLWFARRRRLR